MGWVLSLALAVGCGSEDEEKGATKAGGTTGKTLSVVEYRKRANALCARGTREVEQIPPPRSAQEIGTYVEQLVRQTRRFEKQEEQALEPPPKQLRRVHERVDRLDAKGLSVLERAVPRIKASANPQVTAQQELRKLAPIVDEEIALARKLGLKDCLNFAQPGQERGA